MAIAPFHLQGNMCVCFPLGRRNLDLLERELVDVEYLPLMMLYVEGREVLRMLVGREMIYTLFDILDKEVEGEGVYCCESMGL